MKTRLLYIYIYKVVTSEIVMQMKSKPTENIKSAACCTALKGTRNILAENLFSGHSLLPTQSNEMCLNTDVCCFLVHVEMPERQQFCMTPAWSYQKTV